MTKLAAQKAFRKRTAKWTKRKHKGKKLESKNPNEGRKRKKGEQGTGWTNGKQVTR